jgi:UDP-apiose/xylose synthase
MDFIPGVDGEGVPRVLAMFMHSLLSGDTLKLVDGGYRRRCFTDINDAVAAIVAIIEHPANAAGQVFNIGNPCNEFTIRELALRMIDAYHSAVPESRAQNFGPEDISAEEFYGTGYDDSDRRLPDISKAKELLSWEPVCRFDETLHEIIHWYRSHYGTVLPLRRAV